MPKPQLTITWDLSMPSITCEFSTGMFEESILIKTPYGTASIPIERADDFLYSYQRFVAMVAEYQQAQEKH